MSRHSTSNSEASAVADRARARPSNCCSENIFSSVRVPPNGTVTADTGFCCDTGFCQHRSLPAAGGRGDGTPYVGRVEHQKADIYGSFTIPSYELDIMPCQP